MTASEVHLGRYVLPASFAQERLWFLAQLEPDSDVAYHVHTTVAIDGRLDRLVLQHALDAVVARHESLRTGIGLVDGQPRQLVLPRILLTIPVVDRTGADETTAVAEVVATSSARRFALDEPPLVRVALVRLHPQRHVLVLVLHHIVCDGWSIGLLLRDLATAYERLSHGATPLGETAIQYADFAAWQRETLSGDRLAELTGYWRDRLRGLTPLEIPTDRPRPPVRSARGATCHTHLPADLVTRFTSVAARRDATLFMGLVAVFAAVLSRQGGERDVAIGTAIANRTRRELDDVVGLFANTLVLRTSVAADSTFETLLDHVRDSCRGAYAHQDLPFEKVVEELRPERDLSRTPLFQAMLLLQDTPPSPVTVGELTFTPAGGDPGTTKFDLTLEATPAEDGLSLALHHATDLFDRATAQRLLNQVVRLARAAVAAPGAELAAVDLRDDRERAMTEHEWARGPRLPLPAASVDQLVRAQAARAQALTAVRAADATLTYAGLIHRVDVLATRLRAAGVRPGDRVAVCVERSAGLVVALLSVLTAGAAYVPVDPGYPTERIAVMLQDSEPRLVLATTGTTGALPADGPPTLLADRPGPDEPATAEPAGPLAPDRAAYVIYTSGSTGAPKGVEVGHRSLVNVLTAIGHEIAFTPADVMAAVASVSFDIAALELFLPLVSGGQVVVADEDDVVDGSRLAELVRRTGVTVLQATPATWRMLLLAGWHPDARTRMLCTGEALEADLAERLLDRDVPLWNLYGPTETTLYASAGRITDPRGIGLGAPVANTVRHVLDGALRPVPPGAVGELYVGGAATAYGYLGRPGLTAERFLPDPVAGVPGARMYRTADLCRYRTDGSLEYLGRADQQIKIRGFRVEPGEVEAVLAGHPDVTAVAVVARRVSAGDVRLVAGVVARETDTLVGELRELARRELPAQMVPSVFTVLAELPLTPSGKVDRAALCRDADLAGGHALDETAPRNDTERRIAAIFAEVLGVEQVGVHASFFDLGGHSLLAAKFAARLRAETGVAIPLRDLFARPTVAAVATAVTAGGVRSQAAREDAAVRDLLADLTEAEIDALLGAKHVGTTEKTEARE